MSQMSDESVELEPWLLLHEGEGGAQFATWRVAEAESDALVFCRDEASAAAYRESAGLGGHWQPHRPDRRQLAMIIRAAIESNIPYAVLDPDAHAARRIFQLEPMWAAIVAELGGF